MKLKGLGRGLDALLDAGGGHGAAPASDAQATLPVEQLQRGKYQPRTRMDESSLQELASSIKAQGLMQPILVRKLEGQGQKVRYEIIAGERRWRAAQLAGLTEVPVLVRDVPDNAALAMALIENIQREDLNPLEEALGIQRLITEFKITHQEAADAVGRSRTATTNLLRLLNLTKQVQQMLFDGKLEMGHARALLGIEGRRQQEVAESVVVKGLSVRQTEQLVHDLLNPKFDSKPRARVDRDVERYQEELSHELGTTIEIKAGKKGAGKLVIHYADPSHLDDMVARLKR
jgi:ParB family chromosome partitioning protein